jgi:adenylate cyclase class 2
VRTHPGSETAENTSRQEVEVKYRVLDVAAVLDVLSGRGLRMSTPLRQDDQAYAPEGWSYDQPKTGVAFARLRTENGRHLFAVKVPMANEMACLEHESEVTDRGQMHGALLAMGFYPTVRIVKTRRVARVGDLSLCLDEVEHAGAFLEVERILPAGESGAAAQAELDQFVRSLGVPVERTSDTYDALVRVAQLPAT